jgi:hypothetical protein
MLLTFNEQHFQYYRMFLISFPILFDSAGQRFIIIQLVKEFFAF